MIQVLKMTWNKYKKLETWKKVLLFLPILILAVVCIVFFFINPKDDKDKYIESVQYNKKQVDKQININQKQQQELEQLDKKIKKEQDSIKKKLEGNYEKAKELNTNINTAVSNNNVDELKRIQSELNAKSRRRRT